MYMSQRFNWDVVIKKEARGIDNCDLGEIQEVERDAIITQRGILCKDKFYLPKNVIDGFDGHSMQFRVMKDEPQKYRYE
jgi:hypothetical protein